MVSSIEELEERVSDDLECLGYPSRNWVRSARHSQPSDPDVLVVGAGMCGQTTAFALRRLGISKVRVIDQAPAGAEGPWLTYARMPTLRTRKELIGPDLGIPSLTYRAWHQARFGLDSWNELKRIARPDWMDYLLWLRQVTDVEVESETRLVELLPDGDGVNAAIERGGRKETLRARKIVLATGREGGGQIQLPRFPSFDLMHRERLPVFHSTDFIDFEALRGARVAILGIGSSAFDNAGCALEAGGAIVVMYARTKSLPTFKKNTWASFQGVQWGQYHLSLLQRWELQQLTHGASTPPPDESVDRCMRFSGFEIRFESAWTDLHVSPTKVIVSTAQGSEEYDAAIVCTGFEVCLGETPPLRHLKTSIQRWRDVLPAHRYRENERLADYPFLGPAFELVPNSKAGRGAHGLSHIYVFNSAVGLSHGALGSEIPGLSVGVARLTQGIAMALFAEDAESHLQSARDFREPVLQGLQTAIELEQR